ncbi:MAG TPA: aminoacyl-tRNA hydrolase [Ilumatobacteraceae bacterium]|nr:aminoacyl-tRNA hydrolase [Ilumatobacteraceae bacterium]
MALFGRGERAERRGTPIEYLIVGLGNPGKEYARTRHNVGEEAVVALASRCGAALKAGKDRAMTAEVTIAAKRCVLAFPLTYMNESGQAVGALARRYAIADPTRLVVVHDELDLAPAQVRVKVGGGLAGNNGLRSITQHLKTQDYVRVRIGVGKPPSKERGAAHVLSRVSKAEREALDVAIAIAADAVEAIVASGPDAAMQRFNIRT